jgi:hypothetical protein
VEYVLVKKVSFGIHFFAKERKKVFQRLGGEQGLICNDLIHRVHQEAFAAAL